MDTVFRVTDAPFTRQVKTITLRNTFDFPVALTNITMPKDAVSLFKVRNACMHAALAFHSQHAACLRVCCGCVTPCGVGSVTNSL